MCLDEFLTGILFSLAIIEMKNVGMYVSCFASLQWYSFNNM